MRFWKHLIGFTLCLGLLAGSIPLLSYAEECDHHNVHTAECGYREAAEEVSCGHNHDENCGYTEAAEEIPCTCQVQVIHVETCAYTPAVEGQTCACLPAEEGGEVQHTEGCGFVAPAGEVPCDCEPVRQHEENCPYTPAREAGGCIHQHDEACGYAEAVEAAECTFFCDDCNQENVPAGHNGGPGPNHQQFTVSYGGKDITIGLGEMMDGALHLYSPGVVGDYYSPHADWPFQRQIVLGAMESQNNGNGAVALAPAEFYNCISNVTVEITSCQNADGNTNGSNCFLVDDPAAEFAPAMQMQATKETIQGVGMHRFYVMADPGNCFEADLKVTFDLTLGGETNSYTIDSLAGYWEVPVIEITAPDNAAELNSILASYDDLTAYLQAEDPEQYEVLRRSSRSPGPENPMLYIRLPGEDYRCAHQNCDASECRICYNIQIPDGTYLGNIELYGAGSGKTILPGLEINGYLTHVWDIGFVSNGVMDSGIRVTDNGINVEQVCNCSFTGFDYGIRNYGKKYVSSVRYCDFTACTNGIYMDCTGEEGVPGGFTDGDNHNNTFQGCRYAVRLVNLPAQMSSYQYRMYDSIFRDNHKDFHITTTGNKHYYYFHRNYYDGVYSEASPMMVLSSEESFRAAAIETDENTTAVVVTNPCRVSSAENSDLWVFGGEGQETRIFAGEAKDMAVSGEAFAAGEHKEITIIDHAEAEVATWIFGNQAS